MEIRDIKYQGVDEMFGGDFIENHPVSFPRTKNNGVASLFYWAYAKAINKIVFPRHPHNGFEIMTFALKGNARHYDTETDAWVDLKAGGVQHIITGSGLEHSEAVEADAEMFQIWFDPNYQEQLNNQPQYNSYSDEDFPRIEADNYLIKGIAGKGYPINVLSPGLEIEQITFKSAINYPVKVEKTTAIYVLEGSCIIADKKINKHDSVFISETNQIAIKTDEACELFIMTFDTSLEYPSMSEILKRAYETQNK